MNTNDFKAQFSGYLETANTALLQAADAYLPEESSVCRAARYSLLDGGKRIRAILVLSVCDLLNGSSDSAAAFASAIEMVHCYSLIHDDLPCMDNDDYRRGKLSCHKAFDEATAMLAGDVLLTEAFEAVSCAPCDGHTAAKAAALLSHGAGSRGMVYGQELDLFFEGKSPSLEQLNLVHRHKTGALIKAAIGLGELCGTVSDEKHACLTEYAETIGLVFQIVDDVLDVTSTTEELGKPVGSDAENGKVTYATILGTEAAMQKADQLNQAACSHMREVFGADADFLIALAGALLNRKN